MAGPEHKMFAWGDEWPGPLKPVRPVAGLLGIAGDPSGRHRRLRPRGWRGGLRRASPGVGLRLREGPERQPVPPAQGGQLVSRRSTELPGRRGMVRERDLAIGLQRGPLRAGRQRRTAGRGPRSRKGQSRSKPRGVSSKGVLLPAPIALVVPPGPGRGLSIRVPKCGEGTAHLMAPETVLWNRTNVLTFRDKPDLTWTERTAQRAAYELRLPQGKGRVQAEFLVHDDRVEQRFTATNLTAEPGEFATSSCFRLQGLPMFYDCEQLRTYALSTGGEFVPARRLARGGARVRWITRLTGDALGQDPHSAVLAVVSRDQRQVIVAGRADPPRASRWPPIHFSPVCTPIRRSPWPPVSRPPPARCSGSLRELSTLCATGFRENSRRPSKRSFPGFCRKRLTPSRSLPRCERRNGVSIGWRTRLTRHNGGAYSDRQCGGLSETCNRCPTDFSSTFHIDEPRI